MTAAVLAAAAGVSKLISVTPFILLSLLGIGLIILVHEFGHFIAAKMSRIGVREFVLGFGPKIVAVHRGQTTYGVTPFPFGGYVKFVGSELEEIDKAEPGSFRHAPLWRQASVVLAGPLMNYITATVIMIVLVITVGIVVPTTTVQRVLPRTAASQVGLKAGDKIIEVNDRRVSRWSQIQRMIRERPEQRINMKVERDGRTIVFEPLLRTRENRGFLGIQVAVRQERTGILTGIYQGTRLTYEGTRETVELIVDLIKKGHFFEQARSPVGAVVETSRVARVQGLVVFAGGVAALNVVVALFNLLPMPPLDGGRLALLGVEALIRRPIPQAKLMAIQAVGISILLAFMVYLLLADFQRYIPQAIDFFTTR